MRVILHTKKILFEEFEKKRNLYIWNTTLSIRSYKNIELFCHNFNKQTKKKHFPSLKTIHIFLLLLFVLHVECNVIHNRSIKCI